MEVMEVMYMEKHKIRKRFIAVVLVLVMMLSMNIVAFASSAAPEYTVDFYDGDVYKTTVPLTYNAVGTGLPDCGADGWIFETYLVSDEDGTETRLEGCSYTSSADNNVVTQELMDVLSGAVDAGSAGYTLRYKAFTNRGGSGSSDIEISDEYGQVILKPAEGTKLLTKDGQPLESILVTIEGQEGYWYKVGGVLNYVIVVEAGYTLVSESFDNAIYLDGRAEYDEDTGVYYGTIASGENTIQTEAVGSSAGKNAMSSQANMEDNFFKTMGYASADGSSKYFSEGSAAPEATVFRFLNQTEELNAYCADDTGYVDIPYQTYMNIANAYFTDAPEMKTYLTSKGYLDAETELVHYYSGGVGSDWVWILTSKDYYSNGVYQLRGIFCNGLIKDTTGLTEYVDYYVYNGSAYKLQSAVELTLKSDKTYGYRIAAYTQKPYYRAQTHEMGDCIYVYNDETGSFSDVYYCIYSNSGDYGLEFVYEDGTYTKFDNQLCYAADQKLNWSVRQNGKSYYSYECDKVYVTRTFEGKQIDTVAGSNGTISGGGEVWLWAEPCVEFKMDATHCKVEVIQGLTDRGDGTYSYYQGAAIELRITPDAGYEITEVESFRYNDYVVSGNYISASGTWQIIPDFIPSTILVTTTSTGDDGNGIIIESGEDSTISVTVQISKEEAEKVSGLSLVVEELEERAEEQASSLIINQLGAEADNIYILDIHFENADGEETQVNATMVVTIPLPEGWNSENVGVYYVNTETGEVVNMNAVVSEDGKTLSFTTTHFSYYALVKTASENHTHSYGTAWNSDESKHWHQCACGEKTDEAAHTLNWVIDKEATATEKGSKHQECSVCGYKGAVVEIPATDNTGTATSPQTGDNSNLTLWITLLVVCALGLGGALLYGRRRRTSR